jgi:lysozyme
MSVWKPAQTFAGVIDVSHAQGPINWKLVPKDIVLVFIKATQGTDFVDPLFAQNMADAQLTERLVVPYHFLTEAPYPAQYNNLAVHVFPPLAGRPIMVDWEVDPRTQRRAPVFTMEAFCAMVSLHTGRLPLAYHGMYDQSSPTIQEYPWMVPKYGPEPQGPKWLFWQQTDKSLVPGINGHVDASVFAGTEMELRDWHKSGTMPEGFDV